MAPEGFQTRLAQAAENAQQAIAQALHTRDRAAVGQAMLYATQGGKGLRAFLVSESAALFGITGPDVHKAGGAIEAVHAYSLIHDDLPAMDDDDLRRGRPTVHIAWDEATAILAGDALQALGFELLADLDADPSVRLALIGGLARSAGVSGMVGGQAEDIAAEKATQPLGLDEIIHLQSGKTGALFEWSATAGAILAGEDPKPLATYARAFGLAFQIADDILDVTGDEAAAGKRLQKDADAGKATFVSLLGLDAARTRAEDLIAEAKDALTPYGNAAQTLGQAADFVIQRQK